MFAALLSSTIVASMASAIEPQELVGLWGAERRFGPAVDGTLTIDGRNAEWSAHIGGYEVSVERSKDTLTFRLPHDAGEFRATLSSDGARIVGDWIQPAPVMSDYRFATPIDLTRIAPAVWRGTVAPLVDQLSFYLVVDRDRDGSTRGAFRNPEANLFVHDHFRIARSGTEFIFTSDRGRVIRGTFDADTGRLSLRVKLPSSPPIWNTFDFTRRDRTQAIGYFASTPPEQRGYRAPVSGDGWVAVDASSVGFEDARLTSIVNDLSAAVGGTGPTPYPQGLVVARHGKLVLEEYWSGYSAERPHDMRSAGKSLTSLLAGIAIDRGELSLSTPVVSLFPESAAAHDPKKQHITVENLLTMTSGLACDDTSDQSPGNELTMFAQRAQPDYYQFMLALPVVRDPGAERVSYCSAGINLVGGVIARATHRSFLEAFEERVARPLSFRSYALNLTPTGDLYGAGGLYLRPRDALKLGQVFLDRGRWNGRRIVSERWVAQSTTRHASYNPQHGYGLAWHLFEVNGGGRSYREFEAQGNGGQLIIVVPELDLAVAFTTGNYSDDMTDFERGILARIIEAIRK